MRTRALIARICRQMVRDKRTLALLFVAPLLVLTLMYYILNGERRTSLGWGLFMGTRLFRPRWNNPGSSLCLYPTLPPEPSRSITWTLC